MKKNFQLCFSMTLIGFFFVCQTFAIAPQNTDTSIETNYFNHAQEEGAIMFNPPEGWYLADPKALPPSVKLMVVGKGDTKFPPSINLGTEKYNGNLKNYLKMIKSINESQGSEWKDLGTIRTQGGTASLSQVDANTEWGAIRMMHVILLQETTSTVYILTAAALKEEFPKFYKDFFKSMRSLRFNKNPLEMVHDQEKKDLLKKEHAKIKEILSTLVKEEKSTAFPSEVFSTKTFQENHWIPFKLMISKTFEGMGQAWQKQMIDQVQNDLLSHIPTDLNGTHSEN